MKIRGVGPTEPNRINNLNRVSFRREVEKPKDSLTTQEFQDKAVLNATHTGAAGEIGKKETRADETVQVNYQEAFRKEAKATIETLSAREKVIDEKISSYTQRLKELDPQSQEAKRIRAELESLTQQKQAISSARAGLEQALSGGAKVEPNKVLSDLSFGYNNALSQIDKNIQLLDETYKARIGKIDRELAEINKQIEVLSNQSVSDVKEAEKVAEQIANLQNRANQLQAQRKTLEAEWKSQKAQLEAQKAEVQQNLRNGNQIMRSLMSDPGLAGIIGSTANYFKALKNAQVQNLNMIDAAYTQKLNALRSEMLQLNQQINSLELKLAQTQDPAEREKLQQQLDALKAQRDQVEGLYNSGREEWIKQRNDALSQYMALMKEEQNQYLQVWQQLNEARREAENIILADMMSEIKHQNEMFKIIHDTMLAIRQMWQDSINKEMQYQESIAQAADSILGATWGR